MSLKDKSLEEIEACARQVEEELQKKRDERVLAEGGFQCSVCQRVFPRSDESKEFPGVCHSDGWRIHIQNIRSAFENLEKDYSSVEIVHLGFVRGRYSEFGKLIDDKTLGPIELEHLGGTNHAAVVDSLIMKIGGRYLELGVKLPDDSDTDDPKVTLQLHGTALPERCGDYFVWPKERETHA